MKTHTNDFKNEIKQFGKEIDSKITFTSGGQTIELGKEDLNSITPHYEGSILKSAMRQLDIDSNVEIPLETIINYQFRLKVGNEYEYLNYGNYVVYKVEKQEDTNSYKITCYDKMLYSMIPYEAMNITYPITIRNYLEAICTKLGLTLKNENFANEDKLIQSELYLDSEGNSLDYTFRDVLDEIAGATGSTICINEDTDELEVRYINNTGTQTTLEGTSISIENSDDEKFDLQLQGNTTQITTTGKNICPTNINDWESGQYDTSGNKGTIASRIRLKELTPVEPNTQYYFNTYATDTNYKFVIRTYDSTGTFVSSYGYINNGATLTTGNTIYYLGITMYNSASSSIGFNTYSNLFTSGDIKPLICLNSESDKSYEEYTERKATPSPDYPQPINVVSGRQEINIHKNNLLDLSKFDFITTDSGITIENDTTTGKVVLNGTATKDTFARYRLPTLYTGEVVSLSANNPTVNSNVAIRLYNTEGALTTANIYLDTVNKVDNNRTLTVAYNSFQIRIANGTTLTNFELYPQVEKGSATEYEVYKGNSYEINLGKNLLDTSTITSGTSNGIDYENNNGTITLDGTATANSFIATWNGTNYWFKLEAGTYTISANNETTVAGTNNYIRLVSPSGTAITRTSANFTVANNKTTFTLTEKTTARFQIRTNEETTYDNFVIKPMLEKGSQATSYSPYKEPIELCKIGNYQDFIKKGTGKNLFDKDNVVLGYRLNQSGSGTPDADYYVSPYIKVEPNTTYTKNSPQADAYHRFAFYTDIDATTTISISSDNTITTPSNCQYLRFCGLQTELNTTQLEEGTTATPYEPYGMYNKWYIEKNIGKIILDGTETGWTTRATDTNTYRVSIENLISSVGKAQCYCNYFAWHSNMATNNQFNNEDIEAIHVRDAGTGFGIRIDKNIASTTAQLKTWLSTHNTIVYYPLATPTYTEITDSELLSQLNAIKLLEGINNISVSSDDLGSPIKITYTSELDTIDEEYLKDINVNFGEKFGKVNSIVLSRSAESDNIFLRDEESVLENGLCEIRIKDNQIMNGNNRSDFLPGLLEALDGLEYYINDFASPGVLYYNLCDKYKVKVGDNYYKCIMFNDEANITQGLEENIYTEMPEESETDYTKSDKTDKKINQAYIIVDKQNQQIDSVVQSVNTLSTIVDNQGNQIDALGTRITQTTNEITASITGIEETLADGVGKVKTTSVTIDNSGLNVSTDTSKITTTLTNNSFEIKDSGNNTLAFFGYDENEGISKAEMDNLTVTNYFVAGVHRVEKYTEDGEERTGWFYIGG